MSTVAVLVQATNLACLYSYNGWLTMPHILFPLSISSTLWKQSDLWTSFNYVTPIYPSTYNWNWIDTLQQLLITLRWEIHCLTPVRATRSLPVLSLLWPWPAFSFSNMLCAHSSHVFLNVVSSFWNVFPPRFVTELTLNYPLFQHHFLSKTSLTTPALTTHSSQPSSYGNQWFFSLEQLPWFLCMYLHDDFPLGCIPRPGVSGA